MLLADDLVKGAPALKEMVEAYDSGNMVAVMEVPREETSSYGIVTPGASHGQVVEIKGLVEKPAIEDAPSNLAVIGRYIIEPAVFDILGQQRAGVGGEIQLTDALAAQIGKQPFTGLRFSGTRFDCGSKTGFQKANLAFALERDDMAPELRRWLRDELAQS